MGGIRRRRLRGWMELTGAFGEVKNTLVDKNHDPDVL